MDAGGGVDWQRSLGLGRVSLGAEIQEGTYERIAV